MEKLNKFFPLPSVAFLHPFFDTVQHLIVAQLHPRFADEVARRHLASKTLDDDGGVESLSKTNDEIDVFLQIEEVEMLGMYKVFLGHLRAFEDLQLVELDRG